MTKKGFEKLVFGIVSIGFLLLLFFAGVGIYAMYNSFKISAKLYELSLGLMWMVAVSMHGYQYILLSARLAAMRGADIQPPPKEAGIKKPARRTLTARDEMVKIGPEYCAYGNVEELVDEIVDNRGRYSYNELKEMKADLEKKGFGDLAFKRIKNLTKPWERNSGLDRNYPNPAWADFVPQEVY